MPKRKIEEITGAEPRPVGALDESARLQRQQLDGLLEQSKRALFRALKVARGFERQKLGRRQKAAKAENNDADTARLNAEVAALKSLDLATTAELHIYKSLLKINTISSTPALPQYVHTIAKESRKPLDGASANVQARLFKSGPVKEAMARALGGVRAILGIQEVKAVKKKRLRAKDYVEGTLDMDISADPVHTVKQPSLPGSQQGEERDGSLNTPDVSNEHWPDRSKGSEDDYEKYTLRLAASSDEDSINGLTESNELQEEDLNPESITEDGMPVEADSDESEAETKPKRPKKPPAVAPNSTTFLPSLSMGYFSGSESAGDLSDEGPRARKNRMGQQARRALWEKKFGKNANHVKKQPQDRDEGWDARKGASAGDDRGKRGRGRGRGDSISTRGRDKFRSGRGPMSSGANSDPVVLKQAKPAKSLNDGPLHPSWEAAKKAKDQKKMVPFEGKKVVFD